MQRRFIAALLGSMLLTSVPALADSQCTPAPPSASLPAAAAEPVAASSAPAPVTPTPPPTEAVAPTALPADRAAAAGLHELSVAEIAAIPGLAPIATTGGRIFVMGHVGNAPDLVAFKDHNFQMVSPMADPHFVCRGVVSDDKGNNVSVTDAIKVPGLIAPPDRPVIKDIATPAEAIALFAKAAYGGIGPASAPAVWVVVDPLCPHSQDTVKALIPYAQAGQIRLNIVPVDAFGDISSHAVHVLVSAAPDHMIQDWFQPGLLAAGATQPALGAEAKFQANHLLFAGLMSGPLHVTGVPEVMWSTHDGQAHAQMGLDAPNVAAFVSGLGS